MWSSRIPAAVSLVRRSCPKDGTAYLSGFYHPHNQTLARYTSSKVGGEEIPQPLFLWLGPSSSTHEKARILMPVSPPEKLESIESVKHVVDAVNVHYSNATQFVGGMGESDPGVWFAPASSTQDSLQYLDLIESSIEAVRSERHGVPFGIYTAGNLKAIPTLPKLDCLVVNLVASNPKDYEAATGTKDFGIVCGFIASVAEQGVPVECAVLKVHAGAARDLATSLGARDVREF